MSLLSHLSRVTSPGRTFIPQIDGLRFIAIMGVLAFHIRAISIYHFGGLPPGAHEGLLSNTFEAGHFGVQLFFAISGFILILPFAKHHLRGGQAMSYRSYLIRRVTRLMPPYLIHLGLLFLLGALVLRRVPSHEYLYHNPDWGMFLSRHLLASLVYSHGLLFGAHPYPNIVLWSLETEVQFYLLAPALAKVFAISSPARRRTLLIAATIVFPLLAGLLGNESYLVRFSLIGNLQYFLVGFLLVEVYLAGWASLGSWAKAFDLLLPMAIVGAVFIHFHPGWMPLLPCIVLAACLAAFRGRVAARLLGNSWITIIGGMCYTIYMYHWLMVSSLIRVTKGAHTGALWLDLIIQCAVMVPVITLVSLVLFVLFERPFMARDWLSRLLSYLKFGQSVSVDEASLATVSRPDRCQKSGPLSPLSPPGSITGVD
jgi:peptidoglycan/LPS O-acetylase OafA/YrhL